MPSIDPNLLLAAQTSVLMEKVAGPPQRVGAQNSIVAKAQAAGTGAPGAAKPRVLPAQLSP
jgi:hypothetical protein